MNEISKNLDSIILKWIKTFIPSYDFYEPNIYIGEISNDNRSKGPIWILEYNNNLYLGVKKNIKNKILKLVLEMNRDLIFSQFGMYEISRLTHDFGYYVWGPSWLMFSEEKNWVDIKKHQVEILTRDEFNNLVGKEIFWHNSLDCLRAFVVKDDNKIVAAATLKDIGNNFVEIGVDTHPDSQLSGLGSTVYSAAGRWAFDNKKIPFSSVGPWNIPSTRTQLNSGMKYLGVDMVGIDKFNVPPQPLGSPSPNINMFDYYPEWAKNQNITKK